MFSVLAHDIQKGYVNTPHKYLLGLCKMYPLFAFRLWEVQWLRKLAKSVCVCVCWGGGGREYSMANCMAIPFVFDA